MTEMRRPAVLAVVAVAVCCLAGVASGVALGPPADDAVAATADEPTTGQPPGATVSGAVVAEESALDGQLRARAYERRLLRANDTAARLAVLQSIRADLSARLATLEQRREAVANRSLLSGERVYWRTAVTTEAATLARLANSSAALARQYGNATLAGQLRQLAAESAQLGGPTALNLSASVGVAGFGGLLDGPDTISPTDRTLGDAVHVTDRRLTNVSDRTIRAVVQSSLVEPNRTKFETMSPAERRNATLSDVLTVNESALATLDAADVRALAPTDSITLDVRTLRNVTVDRGLDGDDSVLQNVTVADSLNGTDWADDTTVAPNGSDRPGNDTNVTVADSSIDDIFNVSDGTLNDTDGTLNDTDSTLDTDLSLAPSPAVERRARLDWVVGSHSPLRSARSLSDP